MLVLNFTHPLTEEQLARIAELANDRIDEVRKIPVQFDHEKDLGPQMIEVTNAAGLTANEWQTSSFIVNPPGNAIATAVLLAEIHGRAGHWPTIIRLRPGQGIVTTYEVAELLNLQAIRDQARKRCE